MDDLLHLCHNSISSRVVDAFLDSPSVPPKFKRKLILSFIGHYHQLVDDRIGSRVGDRCWSSADPYLKEKIARSLMNHEQFLAGSFYGKFFVRKLHLHLLKRKPEEWKALQATVIAAALPSSPSNSTGQSADTKIADPTSNTMKKRKREPKQQDEIDELFSVALGKKKKKGALLLPTVTERGNSESLSDGRREGDGLNGIFDAIRAAPKVSKVESDQTQPHHVHVTSL